MTASEPALASVSGACPLCSKWIAKNRSWIVALPVAVAPRCDPSGRWSLDDGGPYYGSEYVISQSPRRWIHWYCAPRFGAPLAFEPLDYGDDSLQVAPIVPPLSGEPRVVPFPSVSPIRPVRSLRGVLYGIVRWLKGILMGCRLRPRSVLLVRRVWHSTRRQTNGLRRCDGQTAGTESSTSVGRSQGLFSPGTASPPPSIWGLFIGQGPKRMNKV